MPLLFRTSGQFVYFSIVNTNSGLGITGAAANISGRRTTDGGAFILFSGAITEIGAGLYAQSIFDWDISGNNLGYLFTASGVAPTTFNVYPWIGALPTSGGGGNVLSGNLSGQLVGILSGQLSGQVVNLLSGNQVQVWSGTNVNVFSGNTTIPASGQLSGQLMSIPSGTLVDIFSGQLSGFLIGHLSGQLSGFVVNLLSGNQVQVWSGTNVNVFSGQLSGQLVGIYSGQLSGYVVTPQSGRTFLASGSVTSGVISSGVFVNAPAAVLASGTLAIPYIRIGQCQAGSTATTLVLDAGASAANSFYDDNIVILTAGLGVSQARSIQSYTGATQTATIFPSWVTTPDATTFFLIAPFGQVDVGNWNNNAALLLNSLPQVAASINIDKSGYTLGGSGLDTIQPESGINVRQMIAGIFASTAGMTSGAGTTQFFTGNESGILRGTYNTDQSGNRTLVALTLPT